MNKIIPLLASIICLNLTNIDAQSLTEIGRIDVGSAGSNNIMGVVVGPDGFIYYVDRTQQKVFRIENSNVTNGNLEGYLTGTNVFNDIATGAGNGVASPMDLDFNPQKPNQLWVVNQGTNNSGGSSSTITDPGSANQNITFLQDGNAWHFMALATSMAFGDNGNWATAQGILDANRNGGNFTGPTLWSGDLSIYAKVGDPPTQSVNGSHLDMIHQSPFGMGIAHEKDNVYWVFDGYSDNIVRYDFVLPHYPGGDDHSDGVVRRYVEVQVERKGNLPAHLDFDKKSGMLFICDTDNSRILFMNTNTGSFKSNLAPANFEPLAEYSQYTGVQWGELVGNLGDPVGIDVSSDSKYLIVSDNATNEIIIYNAQKATGIENVINPEFSFNIFPNPTNGIAKLDIEGLNSDFANVIVTNILGKTILNTRINTNQNKSIDFTNLAPGVYHVTMYTENQTFSRKVIKN